MLTLKDSDSGITNRQVMTRLLMYPLKFLRPLRIAHRPI